MFFRRSRTIQLFDRFVLTIPSKFKCRQDGLPGRRTLFITDRFSSFIISFEETMEELLQSNVSKHMTDVCSHVEGDKAIRLYRNASMENHTSGGYAFFSIEMEGGREKLFGQMTAKRGYRWSEHMEPVLITILQGMEVQH